MGFFILYMIFSDTNLLITGSVFAANGGRHHFLNRKE